MSEKAQQKKHASDEESEEESDEEELIVEEPEDPSVIRIGVIADTVSTANIRNLLCPYTTYQIPHHLTLSVPRESE